jgi:hypothetical protein
MRQSIKLVRFALGRKTISVTLTDACRGSRKRPIWFRREWRSPARAFQVSRERRMRAARKSPRISTRPVAGLLARGRFVQKARYIT